MFHVVFLLASSDLCTQTSEPVFAGNVIGGPLAGAVKVLGVSLAPKFWINFWEAHDVLRGTHHGNIVNKTLLLNCASDTYFLWEN